MMSLRILTVIKYNYVPGRIVQAKINTINSVDNDTTMTFIAAGMGIGLVPSFCNNHSGEFEWTPI